MVDYLNIDEFFRDSGKVSLGREVYAENIKKDEEPKAFSQTTAGKQASQWSGLLDKCL